MAIDFQTATAGNRLWSLFRVTVSLFLADCILPGGPGRPGGPGKNMGDVRIFSLVICSGTSALFDSMAILKKDTEHNDLISNSARRHFDIIKYIKYQEADKDTYISSFPPSFHTKHPDTQLHNIVPHTYKAFIDNAS